MKTSSYYLTAQGRIQLKDELKKLRQYMERAASVMKETIYFNSENGDTEIARSDIEFAEQRMSELQQILEKATTIRSPRAKSIIRLGAIITVSCIGIGYTKKRQKLKLVGSLESNPSKGLVSDVSPLGQALLGKQPGETVVVVTPSGEINYKIISIK